MAIKMTSELASLAKAYHALFLKAGDSEETALQSTIAVLQDRSVKDVLAVMSNLLDVKIEIGQVTKNSNGYFHVTLRCSDEPLHKKIKFPNTTFLANLEGAAVYVTKYPSTILVVRDDTVEVFTLSENPANSIAAKAAQLIESFNLGN